MAKLQKHAGVLEIENGCNKNYKIAGKGSWLVEWVEIDQNDLKWIAQLFGYE